MGSPRSCVTRTASSSQTEFLLLNISESNKFCLDFESLCPKLRNSHNERHPRSTINKTNYHYSCFAVCCNAMPCVPVPSGSGGFIFCRHGIVTMNIYCCLCCKLHFYFYRETQQRVKYFIPRKGGKLERFD